MEVIPRADANLVERYIITGATESVWSVNSTEVRVVNPSNIKLHLLGAAGGLLFIAEQR